MLAFSGNTIAGRQFRPASARAAVFVSQPGELSPEGLPVILIRSRTWRQPGNLPFAARRAHRRHGPAAGPGDRPTLGGE